jgi:hypothetical protein
LHVRESPDGREYGSDDVDPLLWRDTQYLLSGKPHREALAVLDKFLTQHAERLITDPVRRAIFQYDLWRVFDWADAGYVEAKKPAARELQIRIARVMQRVALTREEIRQLPENLQQASAAHAVPALLSGLFDRNGPWVCVYPRGGGPVASTHAGFFNESTFLVFVRLPGGRADTLAYLDKLNAVRDPMVIAHYGSNSLLVQNPEIPQFPPGTRTVLLRQMMLVDPNGEVVPTHLTLSVQTRLYRTIPSNRYEPGEREEAEYDLSREKLFAGRDGGLAVLNPNDRRFSVFMTRGDDPFENPRLPAQETTPLRALATCHACHESSGIHSVCTYMCNARAPQVSFSLNDIVGLYQGDPDELRQGYVWFKQSHHDFGFLQGLWLTPVQ